MSQGNFASHKCTKPSQEFTSSSTND